MSVETRMSVLYVLLAVAVFTAGASAVLFGVKTHTITHTRTVRVQQSYGTPDRVIDGAQINPGLAGTTCRVYSAKRTVVCS